MHVPDGFLDAPTSVATGVVAAAACYLMWGLVPLPRKGGTGARRM